MTAMAGTSLTFKWAHTINTVIMPKLLLGGALLLILGNPLFSSPSKLQIRLSASPSGSIQAGTSVMISATCVGPHIPPVNFKFQQGSLQGPEGAHNSWTKPFPSPGEFLINVQAIDASGAKDHGSLIITVRGDNQPPVVRLSADKPACARQEMVTYTAEGKDPEGWMLRYQFIRQGKIMQDGPSKKFQEKYSTLGEQEITVRAIDDQGGMAESKTKVLVTNQSPRLIGKFPQKVKRTTTFQPDLTILDPDEDKVSIIYRTSEQAQWQKFSGSLQFQLPGKKEVQLQAVDIHGGKSEVYTFTITVENTPPQLELSTGTSEGYRNEEIIIQTTASDIERDKVTIACSYPGTQVVGNNILFSTSKLGRQIIAVSATDTFGGKVTQTIEMDIINRSPTGQLMPVEQPVRGQPLKLIAKASDPDMDNLLYSFSFHGGQWSEPAETNSIEHTFANPGTHTLGCSITDPHGGKFETSTHINVNNQNPVIKSVDLEKNGHVGQSTTVRVSAEDPEGDPLTYHYKINGVKGFESALASLLVVPKNIGDYQIEVTVTDPWGGVATRQASLQVVNRKPSLDIEVGEPDLHGGIIVRAKGEDPDNHQLTYQIEAAQEVAKFGNKNIWYISTPWNREVRGQVQVSDGHGGETVLPFRTYTLRFSLLPHRHEAPLSWHLYPAQALYHRGDMMPSAKGKQPFRLFADFSKPAPRYP